MCYLHKLSDARFNLPATSARANSSLYEKAQNIGERTLQRFRSPLIKNAEDSLMSTPVKMPFGVRNESQNASNTFQDIFSA